MLEAELSLLFLRPLNKLGIRYMVSGSVASPDFYVPPVEIIAAEIARAQNGQFNLIHTSTGFKADIYTAGRDDFNAWAFRRARKLDFRGESIWVAPPECVIVRKLEYFREGGSEKHLRDIRAMLNVSGELINRDDLNFWIKRRSVEAQWKLACA
jgi:hypothetical protein